MIFTQRRFKWLDGSTLSRLSIDGKDKFWSKIYAKELPIYFLEDKDRELYDWMSVDEILKIKIPKQTAIPYTGKELYPIIIDKSERFGRNMPHILNVKGFSGIRWHSGSFVEDTEGCPLCGYEWHTLINKNQQPENYWVSKSKNCFSEFFPYLEEMIDKEPCFLRIVK